MSSFKTIKLTALVPSTLVGQRVDQVAASLFSEFSRSRLQLWIREGTLRVNAQPCLAKQKLLGGETLSVDATLSVEGEWSAEPIPLAIVYEDTEILVLNKSADMVVHPAAGNTSGTLLNALLHHCPHLATLPRAGIVHRLDKDTTGLMVVAKTLQSHHSLVCQLQERTLGRHYAAVVWGVMTGGGEVDAPIGRHPQARVKMAVVPRGGRKAVTHYRVVRRFNHYTQVRIKLETGRTHQIRVHMAHIGYPIAGDSVYGGRVRIPKGASEELITTLRDFKRQALHAVELTLEHPSTGETMSWSTPLPPDMQLLLDVLEKTDNAA